MAYFNAPTSSLPQSSARRVASTAQRHQRRAATVSGAPPALNTLLGSESGPFPAFDRITPGDVVNGIKDALMEGEKQLALLEATVEPTWGGLVEPLEKLHDPIDRAWGTSQHLLSVKDSQGLRDAVQEVQPDVVKFKLRAAQSAPIRRAFTDIKDNVEVYKGLPRARQRIVDAQIRGAALAGGDLSGDVRERFNKAQQRLAELSNKFAMNVLDSTKAFKAVCDKPDQVRGVPPTALSAAAQAARESKEFPNATAEDGPWLFDLSPALLQAVLTHAEDRSLREKVYRAYVTRASEGDSDNSALITEILELRASQAEALGYKCYADVSMASKMAELDTALSLLESLRMASASRGREEFAELEQFARDECGAETPLRQWDVAFYAERMRESRFAVDEEKLREYFPLPRVLDGLFALIKRLFGVTVTEAPFKPPLWDSGVQFFQVNGESGDPIAYFYLDPFARPAEKRGGAWMSTVADRSAVAGGPKGDRLPVAHMVLNQMPPADGKPSLMRFREVETLFHEMGHALQHMLTVQSDGFVSGINGVEWDVVEVPSQFMENWLYDRKTLLGLAQHYETGEALPEEDFERICSARTFRAGAAMLRQLRFATSDLKLHSTFEAEQKNGTSPYDFDREIALEHEALEPLEGDRFLNSFSHIFAGGYAAGYYSYKWAEVLSADCFAAFEEAGLDDEEAVSVVGRRFKSTVLAQGGGEDPMKVFQTFRGREPSVQPLLRHAGLAPDVKYSEETIR